MAEGRQGQRAEREEEIINGFNSLRMQKREHYRAVRDYNRYIIRPFA